MTEGRKLGICLACYADDTTLESDGTSQGKKLQMDLQTSLDVVGYIAWKKSLISVEDKQKYVVFDADASDAVHKACTLTLR